MKKIWNFLLVACGLAALSACDTNSGWEEATLEPLAQAQQRHVLVEDYTGQMCINCPQAAKQLQTIAKTLPGSVFVVSMHAPMTGQTLPDLATETADVYAKAVNLPTSAPHISVNRQEIKGQRFLTNRAEWESAIFNAVNTPAAYRIDLKATLQEKQLSLTTDVKQIDAEKRDLNLLVWIVEDVRARQILDGKMNNDYFHHNVFRAALNGNWGENLVAEKDGKFATKVLMQDLPANVANAENAKVVALIRDNKTSEILEAAVLPLGKGISEEEPQSPIEEPQNPEVEEPSVEEPAAEDYIWFSTKADGTGDKLYHGQTFECHKAQRFGFTTLDSGMLYIHAGKKQGDGKYEIRVTTLDDLDDPTSGLSQVCIEGQCADTKGEKMKAYQTPFTIGPNQYFVQYLSVHYRVNQNRLDEKATYRVRVAVLQNGEEIAHYFLNMNYDPENVEVIMI